jgi:hypothetical protein
VTESRRELLAHGARLGLGAAALSLPAVFYAPPWTERAAAQTLPTVRMAFVALVEAVTTDPDERTAEWIIEGFDRALPPLPDRIAVSAAVTAILDVRTASGAHAPTFATATPDQRREVLEAMVKDADPDIRQLANQLIPFTAFAYCSDATLDEPAEPGGARLGRWDDIGFPGPSHSYLDTYTEGGPEGFSPMRNFER